MLCRKTVWKSTLLDCHCIKILKTFESSKVKCSQNLLCPSRFQRCRREGWAWLCAAPLRSPAGSWSVRCNPHSAKSWKLVIDCLHGAVPFMSQRTIYAVKVSHMVRPPRRGGALIVKDELEVQCRALMGKMEKVKTSGWFRHLLCSFLLHWALWMRTLYPLAVISCYTLYFLAFSVRSLCTLVFLESFLGKLFPLQLFLICIFAVNCT